MFCLEISIHCNPKLEAAIAQQQSGLSLNLDKQQLSDDDMKIVAQQMVITKRYRSLSVAYNEITSRGSSFLANALCNNMTLQELWLSTNRISDTGVRYLAQALMVNKTLKKLGLARNEITDAGVLYLIDMLKKNKTLTMLGLAMNKIGDHGVQMLADTLAQNNTTLETLTLDRNPLMTDKSVDVLIYMMKRNRAIKELWINECNISEIGQRRLQETSDSKKHFKLVTVYEKQTNN